MNEELDYGEYLRRVAEQEQRDRDRYFGTDSHTDKPAYSMRDGKSLRPAEMHIRLDADGWPQVLAYHANNNQERWALSRAEAALNVWAVSSRPGETAQDAAQRREQWHRDDDRKRREEIAAHAAAHPFVCPRCTWMRFKTERGLKQHQSRRNCPA